MEQMSSNPPWETVPQLPVQGKAALSLWLCNCAAGSGAWSALGVQC